MVRSPTLDRLSSPLGASKQAETHTYLAHALTRYLGVSSPDQLVAVGVQGIGGLVDLISKVFYLRSCTLDVFPEEVLLLC
jgi:hypothetical protein